jgi:hypothetical protein
MRTPFGTDCPYFYGDYHRGKNIEECRLIGSQSPPGNWTSDLCRTCPVPSIKRANACEHMQLIPVIKKRLGLFKRYVTITAYCHFSKTDVPQPHIGCGLCHPVRFVEPKE